MIMNTYLYRHKDGSLTEFEEQIERDHFTTNNFFSFWEKFKENYSVARVEIRSYNAEPQNFITDSEEFLYISYTNNYYEVSYYQVRSCDLISFLNAKNFFNRESWASFGIHIEKLVARNYIPWTLERG